MEQSSLVCTAERMLEHCDSVALASITEDGYPRICEMEKVRMQGLRHLYFITLKSSHKVGHFRLNSKSSVGCCMNNDSISLMGNVTIIESEAAKQEVLPAAYLQRLRKRDCTKYCILHFETVVAKLFIGGVFETSTLHEANEGADAV